MPPGAITPRVVVFSAPTPRQPTTDPRLPQRLPDTHRWVWLSLSWGRCSFLLGPGAQVRLCPPRVCFPSPVGSCNRIPLASKVKFPGLLSPFAGCPDNLEPDILECEVKWALGSFSMNKASRGDRIPVEPFQILKDDAVKVLPANLKSSAVATGLETVSFNSNSKERQCQRMLKLLHNCTHLTC